MLVKEVMTRQVATVAPDTPLVVAARKMRDQDVGCLPVIDHGRLIGMITDRDIVLRGVADGTDLHRVPVQDAMSTSAIVCSTEHTVERARELMAANAIKHLPVRDPHGRVVGLITLRDVSGQLAKCKPQQVTFYKRLATSSGRVRDVEVAKVYLSPAVKRDDLLSAALAKFEQDRGLACWEQAADGYELKEGC